MKEDTKYNHIDNSEQETMKRYKEKEIQDKLIQALTIPYENVYAVNMDTGEAICYRMGQAISDRYGEKFAVGNYEQNISSYIENDILEEDRHLFDKVRFVSDVRELLSDTKTYYFNYRVFRNENVQYFQCQLVKPTLESAEFIIGFKNIDEEKKQELAQQKKVENALAAVEKVNEILRDEMEIASALSKEYPDVVLLDFANDTAVTIKRMGTIIAENQRVIRRSYYDTWNHYISKYVLEEDKDALKAAISIEKVKSALKNSDEYSCSYRIVVNETDIHYYQASFIRFYSRHQTESQIILGFRCVDAIVEEERKNRTIQEEQFRIIGALSQEYHSLFKIDAETGEVSLFRTDGIGMDSEKMEKMMEKKSYKEILSTYIDTYIVPEDRERIRRITDLNVLLEQVPENGLYKLGYRRSINGEFSYYEMNVARIVNDNGTITFIMGLRDVNEEMQRQLKQAREIEAQSEIIEGLGSEYYSILLVDPDTDTVTTYRAEDEDGRSIKNYFHKYDNRWSKGLRSYANELVSERSREEFLEKLSLEYISSYGKGYSLTYEKLTDAGIIYLQARVAFVQEMDGGFVAVIGTRNVDDLIKKERQQEMALQEAYDVAEAANKAKTEFLSNMSHDIRTPMNAIVGYAELMKKEIHNPQKLMEYQKKLQMSSEFLLSLLNDVLDMARIESGKEKLDEDYHNKTGNIVAEVIRVFEMQAQEKNITLKSEVDVEHEYIMCDIVKVREIFTNLVSNAIKYTPVGGCICISTKELPSNREGYVLYRTVIEDNGIGMSKEFLPHLFDSFARERNTTQGKIAGTGLGMAIVKALIELMDGTIEVESELGVGTKFILTIPHKIAQNNYYEAPEKKQDMDKTIFQNKRILLAEDNDLNAEIAMELLKDVGFLVERAEDGVICIDMLQKSEDNYYNVILMDIQMPNMDGYKATRVIRRMQQSYKRNIPIIAMTANAFEEDKKMAMDSGMNGHLAKPINVEELLSTLADILG